MIHNGHGPRARFERPKGYDMLLIGFERTTSRLDRTNEYRRLTMLP